jgi:hypothetical protein
VRSGFHSVLFYTTVRTCLELIGELREAPGPGASLLVTSPTVEAAHPEQAVEALPVGQPRVDERYVYAPASEPARPTTSMSGYSSSKQG